METKDDAVDLSSLDTSGDTPFEFQVSNPATGELLDFFIEVVGADSDTYQTKYRQLQRRMAEQAKRSGRNTLSPEQIDSNANELLTTATRKWRGSVKLEGSPLPSCTPDNVGRVLRRFKWLKEQVDTAVHERANFLSQPAKS